MNNKYINILNVEYLKRQKELQVELEKYKEKAKDFTPWLSMEKTKPRQPRLFL